MAARRADIEAALAQQQAVVAGLEDEIAQLRAEEEAAAAAAAEQARAAAAAGPVYYAPQDGGGGGGDYAPPPPGMYSNVLDIAALYIGVPYVWGGSSPAGFDCSGLVQYCYAQLGVYLPRTTYGMMEYGSYVAYGDLQPGDLVITSGGGHVGLYVGGGTMIHAPMPGYSVCYSSIYDFYMGRRP